MSHGRNKTQSNVYKKGEYVWLFRAKSYMQKLTGMQATGAISFTHSSSDFSNLRNKMGNEVRRSHVDLMHVLRNVVRNVEIG